MEAKYGAIALSKAFSPSVIRALALTGKSKVLSGIIAEAKYIDSKFSCHSVADFYDYAFKILRKSQFRGEYVYKCAITHNVLLGVHSLNTASIISEFRIGTCKADLIVLNGSGTVYEIKSERDSLSRLPEQISQYQSVFPKIYVIAGENHTDKLISSIPDSVGVLKLSRWNRVSTIRLAQENFDHLNQSVIFNCLRTDEAFEVLRILGYSCPDLPNTKIRNALEAVFLNISSRDLHVAMVECLKKTRSLAYLRTLVDELPLSLQPVALSIRLCKKDCERLVRAVSADVNEALLWG